MLTDLIFLSVLIEVVDDQGLVCPASNLDIQLHVSGAGMIAGIGNGNPQSIAPFQSDHIQTFNGKAMLILRSGTQKGSISVTATSADLQEQKVTITVN
jgi:beta-galactosidase